jgi:hypothetical protein
MKLELKHLAGYLPYGLKAKMNIFSDNQTEVGIEGLSTIGEVELSGIRTTVNEFFDISEIKPILRPLSDLTKEIEVNGEKFMPLEWFEHDSVADYFDGNIWVKFLFEDGRSDDLSLIPFGMIQKLLEWHFDIYGLIEAKLAIDINTLNQ